MNAQTIQKNMTDTDGKSVVTDVIVILDESGSMKSMGLEPIQSANVFLMEQQKYQTHDDGAKATFVTFNTRINRVIDNQKLSEIKEIKESDYIPKGGTALNDAVCATIKSKLDSDKPDNVVLVIITDGEENSSHIYSTEDTRKMIDIVEKKHAWKVIFIGANVDVFADGLKININPNLCTQYNQTISGDLLSLFHTTSYQIDYYRRSRSEGNVDLDISIDNMMSGFIQTQEIQHKRITTPSTFYHQCHPSLCLIRPVWILLTINIHKHRLIHRLIQH